MTDRGLSLDPRSATTLARAGTFLLFVAGWCLLVHLVTARPVSPARMLHAGVAVAVAFAIMRGERPFGTSLNFWDEAAIFLGASLAAALVWPLAP